jgi:hypothetical protein
MNFPILPPLKFLKCTEECSIKITFNKVGSYHSKTAKNTQVILKRQTVVNLLHLENIVIFLGGATHSSTTLLPLLLEEVHQMLVMPDYFHEILI